MKNIYEEVNYLKGLYVSFYMYKRFLIIFLLPICVKAGFKT